MKYLWSYILFVIGAALALFAIYGIGADPCRSLSVLLIFMALTDAVLTWGKG